MTRSSQINLKNALRTLGIAALLLAALPLLAALALGARYVLPVVLIAGVVAWLVSPAFRNWFLPEAQAEKPYHGFRAPAPGLSLHPGHAWARLGAGGSAEVGVDDLLQKTLGPIDAVAVQPPGTAVGQGQRLFTLVRAGRQLEVKAPVSGVVREINPAVIARPGLVNQAPYQDGWLVRLDGAGDGEALQQGASVGPWFRAEVDRLLSLLSRGSAPAMADGGVAIADLSAHIDDARWDEIRAALF